MTAQIIDEEEVSKSVAGTQVDALHPNLPDVIYSGYHVQLLRLD